MEGLESIGRRWEFLMSWSGFTKTSDPMYLRIEAGFVTRPRLDLVNGITHRMSSGPETIHWSHVLLVVQRAGTVRATALLL
jgi:hypothetical protein